MDRVQDFTDTLRQYFSAGALQSVPKNTPIVTQNKLQKSVYFVRSGYVRVYSTNNRGEQYTHILYGAGEIFPLTWLTKQQLIATVYESLTDTEVHSLPLDQVNHDLINQNGLSLAFLRQSVEQYRIYAMRLDNLEYKYASERLAYCLILLANRFGERSGEAVTIVPPMTHQMLATSLNLSRESVSREMEKLLRHELVRYNAARQIILTNMQELANQLHVPLHQGLSSEDINTVVNL